MSLLFDFYVRSSLLSYLPEKSFKEIFIVRKVGKFFRCDMSQSVYTYKIKTKRLAQIIVMYNTSNTKRVDI